MIITKDLMQKIESKDTKVIFATDQEAAIIEILNFMYVKRCRSNLYITKIVKLYNQPLWISDYERSGGTWITDVSFQVTGIVYDKYEIITNAIVNKILTNEIVLQTDHLGIGLALNNILQSVKVDQKIPIIVGNAIYKYMKSKIVIQGIPFHLIHNDDHYIINIKDSDIKELSSYISKYEAELLLLDELPQNKVKLIIANLKYKDDKKATLFSKLPLNKNIQVHRPTELMGLCCNYKESNFQSENLKESKEDHKEDGIQNASSILKGFIQNAIKQIILIRELTIEYDPTDKKNNYIWDIYNNYKPIDDN